MKGTSPLPQSLYTEHSCMSFVAIIQVREDNLTNPYCSDFFTVATFLIWDYFPGVATTSPHCLGVSFQLLFISFFYLDIQPLGSVETLLTKEIIGILQLTIIIIIIIIKILIIIIIIKNKLS